ncbi:MAG: enoyl-CoA hydratase/isomerase family protein [Parvibaculaceae bacterium]
MLVQTNVAGPVAIVTLNRPQAHNALNFDVRAAMSDAIERVESDNTIRAVILTGAGQKAFAAGSDIKDMVDMTAVESIALSEAIIGLNERIAKLRQPVICAINGVCLGGGLELALACDIRLCAENARFGFPEAKLGLMTGAGGCGRLVQAVGNGIARHMMLTAEIIDARRAYEIGLVTMVVEGGELLSKATGLAEKMATYAPVALAQIKRTLSAAEAGIMTDARDAEIQACAVCFGTQDKVEGMRAFIEKRPPAFKGQ